MTVEQDGQRLHTWPVSTGLADYDTPSGSYKPFRMEAAHFSREWDNAPMPHAIFFSQVGHAIHGTTHTRTLGRAASHGCVRLAPRHAATLFALIKQQKMANTRVVVEGSAPAAMAEREERGFRSARRGRSFEEDGVRPARWGRQQRDPFDPPVGRRVYRDPFASDHGYARRDVFGLDGE